MRKFSYLTPGSLDEAIFLMKSYKDEARFIAGGTDILIKIKEKRVLPKYLISLKNIPGLDQIRYDEEKGILIIGALVTHRELEKSSIIRGRYQALYDAVSNIGSVQIRNVATIGGNLVNAVSSADGAVPLLIYDAIARIYGEKGEREIPLSQFFLSPGKTVLETGEILTEIIIPEIPPYTGSSYIKWGRREAMELAMLGVGVLLSLDIQRGVCIKARIGLGVAAPTPIRSEEAESFLEGKEITPSVLEKAGNIAADGSKVRDSFRGSAWYRREMIKVLVKRMGLVSLKRAKSDSKGV